MQEAIPLCLDQNTSELQKRPLCIHLQNVLYNIFLSRMAILNDLVLAWKCLEYIILNNPRPKDRRRTFIPAKQMNPPFDVLAYLDFQIPCSHPETPGFFW